MNARFKLLALISAVSVFSAFHAKADTVVYDNGPINGTINAWSINNGFSVSDSFTVASDAALTSATVGLWTSGTPLSLAWSIGTTVFGSEISSGIATLTNSYLSDYWGYSIYESSFAINGEVSVGTYYLTLSNASSSDQSYVYWDQNNGPSTAKQNLNGEPSSDPYGSHSFKLESGSSVPDSGTTLALFGAALVSLVAFRRRFAA